MTSIKDIVQGIHGVAPEKVQAGWLSEPPAEPYYTTRHIRWLELGKREWSPAALAHAEAVLSGGLKMPRERRVSPSSIGGDCERELLFSFGGAPKLPSPPKSEDVMESGEFEHLRWQMEGLSLPFLQAAEVYLHHEGLRCGGSIDGLGVDHSLFELKNTAPHLFQAIAKGSEYLQRALDREARGEGSAAAYAAHMLRKHKLQMEAYFLVDSLQPSPILNGWGSLVYQDRESKDTYEIRLQSNPGRRKQIHRILESTHTWVDLNELPDMLEGCAAAVGLVDRRPTTKEQTIYDRCGYREWCPTAKAVTTE